MRIINYTRLDPAELKRLLLFAARGTRHARVELHIKNESRYPHGTAYWRPPAVASVAQRTRSLITLHLPATADSPLWPKDWYMHIKRLKKLYPAVPLDSWQDCVITLAAHEFRHIWQGDRAQRRRRLKACGQLQGSVDGKGEYDADRHAIRTLSRWRIATGRSGIEPVKQPNPFKKETRV